MEKIGIIVAHKITLYKQALAEALKKFSDITIPGQARFLDELIKTVNEAKARVIVAQEEIFSGKDPQKIINQLAFSPYAVLLTDDPHRALETTSKGKIVYFYTGGYLIDLYRTIKSLVEKKDDCSAGSF